jgi:glycosyltransferase involved in cell wall biosynthesis
MKIKVCFVGGARYSQPLDKTSAKKFGTLMSLGELFVIGFSQDIHPRWFTAHAHFYLLPKLPLPILRYIEMFLLGPILTCWLIFHYRVQVLVAQSPYEGFAAALAKKIGSALGHKVALVVENHGDFEESLFLQRHTLFPRLYRFLMRYAARFTFKHADSLRAISNATRHQLGRWVPERAIIQFPTWTDIEVFLQAGTKAKDTYMQEVLYVGVLIPRKGIHHLINAFSHIINDFPQVKLVIVGREENKTYAAELKEQVKRFGLNGCVQFVGEVPQTELAAWMRRAYVFVLPSVSEGLGRVVVEAMATGTPVIGSSVGGIPEMVKDNATGFLVQPGDEAMLAERLRWLLEHPDDKYAMGRRARVFAEQFFSADAYVEGYKQIFATVRALLSE